MVKAKLANERASLRQWKPSLSHDFFQFQLQQIKSLEVVTSDFTTRKKAEQAENQWLFLDPPENWDCRANQHPQIWTDRWVQRIKAKVSLPGAEAAGTQNWQEHEDGNFGELLEVMCGPQGEWESPGCHSPEGRGQTFMGFTSMNPTGFSLWRVKRKITFCLWQAEGESNHSEPSNHK